MPFSLVTRAGGDVSTITSAPGTRWWVASELAESSGALSHQKLPASSDSSERPRAGGAQYVWMDDAVRSYVDGITIEHRALFDRLHRLIIESHPDAHVVLSYGIPTYKLGKRRLYVGAWKHGVSIY